MFNTTRTSPPLLTLLVVCFFAIPSHAQPHTADFRSCPSFDGCDRSGIKPHIPLGFAVEDWSLRYASGRSNLSTVVPMTLGFALLRINEARTDDFTSLSVTSIGVFSAGIIIGPSMGEWCLGGDCARKSLLPLGLRVAGAGEIAWALHWTARKIDESEGLAGLSLIALFPLVALPGFALLGAGVGWSLRNAARVLCTSNRPTASSSLTVTPTTLSDIGGAGWTLRLRW